MSTDAPAVALAVATALHAGFQLVVTAVVYPAFAGVRSQDWPQHHRVHSRRVSPVVAVVYGLLLGAGGWVLVAGPVDAGSAVALVSSAVAVLVTAGVAAPAHSRLAGVRGERDMAVLLAADRVRCVAAVVAAAAATWSASTLG